MPNDQFYQHHIFCCTNERPEGHPRGSCKRKGAEDLRNYMKLRLKEEGVAETRVNNAGCLDRCELGPVLVIYPEGAWYTAATRQDIDEIIESHIKGGRPVERLLLQNDQRDLTPAQQAHLQQALAAKA